MSDLSAKFSALEEQLASQAATMGAYVDTVEAKLQSVLDNLDTITINNAANTKALLAAIGQSGACFPCPTPSIVVPPVDTTINPVNSERCQRSQAFIATIHEILAAMDTLQSFNVVGTFSVLNDAISEVISGISAGDTVPLPSFPETVNIVGDYISYAGERLFSGLSLIEQFSPIESALITAMFNSTTAEEAKSAYDGVIGASDATNGAKLLFSAVAYNALYSYFFDPGTTPDLSAFDGAICGIAEGCMLINSIAVTATDASFPALTNRHCIYIPVLPIGNRNFTFGGTSFSEQIVVGDDVNGATIKLLSGTGCRIISTGAGAVFLGPDDTYTFGHDDEPWFIDDVSSGLELMGAFSVQYCPPPS